MLPMIGGCRQSDPTEDVPATRSDVPLRVTLVGSEAWAEAIRTAWGGVSEQPLDIRVVERTAGSPQSAGLTERTLGALANSDVAIVPCGLTPDLVEAEAIVSLGQDLIEDDALRVDQMLSIPREVLMRWAGAAIGIPLGSVQPALLVAGSTTVLSERKPAAESARASKNESENAPPAIPQRWSDFLELAAEINSAAPDGVDRVVAEPLADGGAAKSFLWRANDANPAVWLFSRESFEPVLTDDVYVTVLESMRSAGKLNRQPARLSAGEVWSGVAAGEIDLAVAWPAASGDPPRADPLTDVMVAAPPITDVATNDRIAAEQVVAGDPLSGSIRDKIANTMTLPDPDSPLGVIGSRCRQTTVAKRFLVWLAVGEGRQMIRSAGPAMTPLHADNTAVGDSDDSGYDGLISERLASLQPRPTLRLHAFDRYLDALDARILACLDGQQTAAEALAAASLDWRAITDEIGVDRQARAWRRAQGLRN